MNNLSITTAWNETSAFVRRESGLLFPMALALIALPSILFQWLSPMPAPGQDAAPGARMLLLIPLLLSTLLGSVAISILALRRETMVGAAIAVAARRLLPVAGAVVLLGLLGALAAIPLILIAILVAGVTPSATLLATFLAMLAIVAVSVRFLFVNAIAADTAFGPVALLRRSWALTAGHFWKLLGLLAMVGIVLVVLTMAVTAVGGILFALVAGGVQPGSLGGFLVLLASGIVNALASVYTITLIARIYAQLAGAESGSGLD